MLRVLIGVGILSLLSVESLSKEELKSSEKWLANYVEDNDIQPIRNEPLYLDSKYYLGQALFFDKILSTNKDTACSTCHLVTNHTTDSLDKAIGSGGFKLGDQRTAKKASSLMERNTQSLFNLDNNEAKNLFWDGRVEVNLHSETKFKTALGKFIPHGFENALAVQSLFPIISLSEMRSSECNLEGSEQKYCQRLFDAISHVDDVTWSLTYLSFVLSRLTFTSNTQVVTETQKKYYELFSSAYPEKSVFSIIDVSNAIARFQEVAFATRNTPWDNYLKGKLELTKPQIRGAKLFFDDYMCSNCHSGTLFSDFEFHSIGVISYKKDGSVDLGRYEVTAIDKDKLQFRTPSLRNVTLTAPYMHDGSISDLRSAVMYHFTGGGSLKGCYANCNNYSFRYTEEITTEEIDDLIQFIGLLEDETHLNNKSIIPETVPSGLPIDQI